MLSCPCKQCTERKQGCHGKCARYKEWRRVRDAGKAKRDSEMETTGYIVKNQTGRGKYRGYGGRPCRKSTEWTP